MSQISGYVKEIFEGKVSRGKSIGKPFWSITLDTDNKLSTFKSEFIQGVEVGKEYTFTVEASGDYVNLTAPTVPVLSIDSETIAPDSTTAPQTHDYTDPKVSPFKSGTTVPDSFTDKVLKPVLEHVEKNAPKVYSSGNKDEAIRKAVALKAAVEFSDSVAGSTGNIKKVIEYAKEFEEYLK